MEAAATRAVHGDPVAAARAFLEVLDHWDQVGDVTQQWLNLRYVARLLQRVDARSDAATLHAFLVAAGKPSPLGPPGSPRAEGRPGPGGLRGGRGRACPRRPPPDCMRLQPRCTGSATRRVHGRPTAERPHGSTREEPP